MSMLTICAPGNHCGAESFYNDCPIEIQSLDAAWEARHWLHPDLLRRVAWPGSGRIFPLRNEAIAVEARSFAREHAWLGGIDFGHGHPFDELICLPAQPGRWKPAPVRWVMIVVGMRSAGKCYRNVRRYSAGVILVARRKARVKLDCEENRQWKAALFNHLVGESGAASRRALRCAGSVN